MPEAYGAGRCAIAVSMFSGSFADRVEQMADPGVSLGMIKKISVAALMGVFVAASAFAADGHACCAKQVANEQATPKCVSFANLTLSASQKTKLQGWEADCMKAGCTKESHAKFLKQAKGILSAQQYSTLRKECGSGKASMRS